MKRDDMAPRLNHNQQTTQSEQLQADRYVLHEAVLHSSLPKMFQNLEAQRSCKAIINVSLSGWCLPCCSSWRCNADLDQYFVTKLFPQILHLCIQLSWN